MITSSSRHIRKLWRMVNAVVSARFRRRPPPPLGREMDCWAKPGNSAACRLPRPTVLAAPGRSVREKYQRQGSQQLVARRGAASGDGLSFARGSDVPGMPCLLPAARGALAPRTAIPAPVAGTMRTCAAHSAVCVRTCLGTFSRHWSAWPRDRARHGKTA